MKLYFVIIALIIYPLGAKSASVNMAAAELDPHAGLLLPHNGWVPQVLGIALKDSGYEFNVDFLPFRRALLSAQNGDYDAISPLYISDDREQSLYFSQSLGISRTLLFYRSTKPIKFKEIADLSGLHIAIMRGARVNDEFDRATNFHRIEVTSYEQLVRMLMMGRVDALVGDEFVVRAAMENNSTSKDAHLVRGEIVQGKIALATQGIYAAVSKKAIEPEAIVRAISKGITKLKVSGEYSKILAQHGIGYEDGLLKTVIVK
jgi:polar amino acid transport system substrate-binding protein